MTLLDIDAKGLTSRPRWTNVDTVVIRGGCSIRGLDFTNWVCREVIFLPAVSPLRAALPRSLSRLKAGVDIPVFEDCDFSGMRTRLEPWVSRFKRCVFDDVSVSGALMEAHFVDCTFSGLWEANFTAEANPLDPERVVEIRGNDMRRLTGMSFFGGVPLDANTLDEGGAHLIVRRQDLASREVLEVLERFERGRSAIEALRLVEQQSWVLLDPDLIGPQDRLDAFRVLGHPGRGVQ